MITGIVTPQLQAIVHLQVHGPLSEAVVEAALDTGFNGFLMLSLDTIASLGLPFLNILESELADGSHADVRLYTALAVFDQEPITIEVVESTGMPLLGMSLLHGYEVHLKVVDGGSVEIEALP